MSHISKIELNIKSIKTLEKACNRLGMQFHQEQNQFAWYAGQKGRCDHAITHKDAQYEIGVIKNNKKFELEWDAYSLGGLVKIVGVGAGRLKQMYAVEQAKMTAKNEGKIVHEKKMDGSKIRLIINM